MARKQGWIVVSMKDDWKRIFAFESGRGEIAHRGHSHHAGTVADAHPPRAPIKGGRGGRLFRPASGTPCLLNMLPSHRVGLPL
jgi:hypothetical protein